MLAVYDLWTFVAENWRELLDAFVNTLKVSLIAIAGAAVIGIVLGAARAYRVPMVAARLVTGWCPGWEGARPDLSFRKIVLDRADGSAGVPEGVRCRQDATASRLA